MLALAALASAAGCGSEKPERQSKRTAVNASIGLAGGQSCRTGLRLAADAADDDEAQQPVATPEAEALRSELQRGLPSPLTVVLTAQDASAVAAHYDFRYLVDDVPLCDQVARVHRVGERWLFDGELKRSGIADLIVDASWESLDSTLAAAARSIGADPSGARATRHERCYLLDRDNGVARAAWEAYAWLGERPFRVVGNGATLARVEAQELHVAGSSGQATVYASNPLDPTLTTYKLENLADGDGLASGRFVTRTGDGSPAAASPTRVYDYQPTDPHFAEASVFVHAEQMMAWLTSAAIGFTSECWPIQLNVHASFKDPSGSVSTSNAEYLGPELTDDGLPRVNVGDGDGPDLRNLALDFDVVAHELGHHVFFRKLKSRYGESGVIHEGVADYLLYAKTGNACLGESICPPGSGACVVESACLRTAENNLSIADPSLSQQAHRRSQFLSGMLWDIGKRPEVGHERLARTLVKSVDYLSSQSGYVDLVKGLMSADLELAKGSIACIIYEGAVARGLGDALSGVDCKAYQAP